MVLHGKHWPEQLVTVAIRARMSPVPSGTHQSKRKFCIGMVKSVSNSYVWCCLQNEQALFCFETCKSAHMLSTGMQNKMDASRPTWTFLSLKSTGNFFLGSSVFLASPFFLAGALPPPPRISCSSKILLCCVPVSLVIILKDLRPYCSSFLGIKAAEDTNRGNRNTSVKTFIMVVDAVIRSCCVPSRCNKVSGDVSDIKAKFLNENSAHLVRAFANFKNYDTRPTALQQPASVLRRRLRHS